MLSFCLLLAVGISPALTQAPASSASNGSAPQTPAASASSGATNAPSTANKSAAGKPSAADIAAAKAGGKVWVNTETRVYHKGGRWYGKTKAGKFMTEADAKAAGYKAAQKE
jgi:hypothetical protein